MTYTCVTLERDSGKMASCGAGMVLAVIKSLSEVEVSVRV